MATAVGPVTASIIPVVSTTVSATVVFTTVVLATVVSASAA